MQLNEAQVRKVFVVIWTQTGLEASYAAHSAPSVDIKREAAVSTARTAAAAVT